MCVCVCVSVYVRAYVRASTHVYVYLRVNVNDAFLWLINLLLQNLLNAVWCVCVWGGGGRCVRSVTDVQQDVFFVHKKPTVQLLWGEQVV